MKREFHTKGKKVIRDLTPEEIVEFAAFGDTEAKQEILKQEVALAANTEAKVQAILTYLGVS